MKPNSPRSKPSKRSSHDNDGDPCACSSRTSHCNSRRHRPRRHRTGAALGPRPGETIIIGSRDAQRARDVAAIIRGKVGFGALVSGMENSAACAAADILMLTVPFEGQADAAQATQARHHRRQHPHRRDRPARCQRRRTRFPHSRRLARLRRAAGRRTRAQGSERGRGLPQRFRRTAER